MNEIVCGWIFFWEGEENVFFSEKTAELVSTIKDSNKYIEIGNLNNSNG